MFYMCNQGGQGSRGVVLESVNQPATSPREVLWLAGNQNTYRIGHEGKVDLRAIEPAAGVFYYPDHLARLGQEGSLPSSGMTCSRITCVIIPRC